MRARVSYTDSVMGICGHVCGTWPQILKNGRTWVICDYCTRDAEGRGEELPDGAIWIMIPKPEYVVKRKRPTPRPRRREVTGQLALFTDTADKAPSKGRLDLSAWLEQDATMRRNTPDG